MNPKRVFQCIALALICLTEPLLCLGQSVSAVCGVAPVVARGARPNIFSEQQEIWLGQVEADQAESQVKRMRDPALSDHLQGIVDRLVATLPPTGIKFKVILVDEDEVNAFSLAGGHIYLFRKLAAVAKSDDELAAVLGHEIGHIITHQFAFDATGELKRLLNVTSVGNEADVRKKFALLLDAEMKAKHPGLGDREDGQDEADRVGVYALAAAGYRPQAFAEFWDRTSFVNGKTGGKLTDLLGLTKPNEKRLRGMRLLIQALPSGCASQVSKDPGSFLAWHKLVLANQRGGVKDSGVHPVAEVTLDPPLRQELTRLKFSPDGKSILGQDDSSVFVISRDPFELRYRIDAAGAMPANFSPDSQSLTFNTPGMRTEQWSASTNRLMVAHEMLTKKPCYDDRLSPDGRTMLCMTMDWDAFSLGLELLDTESSTVVLEKKNWNARPLYEARMILSTNWEAVHWPMMLSSYASDNQSLLYGFGEDKVLVDFQHRQISTPASGLRGNLSGTYAFVGAGRIAGWNVFNKNKAGIYSYPEGRQLQSVVFSSTDFESVTKPGSTPDVLMYGFKELGVGLKDLSEKGLRMGAKTSALDEYDNVIVGESIGGMLGLADLADRDPAHEKSLQLPLSPLAGERGVAISPDGRYLALSSRTRGGVWELRTGKELVLMRGFTDAEWSDDGKLYLDMAKEREFERHIAEVSLPADAEGEHVAVKSLPYKLNDETHMRYGRLTDWKEDEKKKTWTLSMHDPATDTVTWSRVFPDSSF